MMGSLTRIAGHAAYRNVPTRVVYDPHGVSHFDMLNDNARMTGLYVRSLAEMLVRSPALLGRRLLGARST